MSVSEEGLLFNEESEAGHVYHRTFITREMATDAQIEIYKNANKKIKKELEEEKAAK